jgi:hypothetical protein
VKPGAWFVAARAVGDHESAVPGGPFTLVVKLQRAHAGQDGFEGAWIVMRNVCLYGTTPEWHGADRGR